MVNLHAYKASERGQKKSNYAIQVLDNMQQMIWISGNSNKKTAWEATLSPQKGFGYNCENLESKLMYM